MAEYRCVRCLFCNTDKEEQIVRFIQIKGWGKALFPQRIKTMFKNGAWTEVVFPLLPGYVFVFSDGEEDRSAEFLSLGHAIHVLTYGDGSDTLMGRDLEFADWLWNLNGRIEVMHASEDRKKYHRYYNAWSKLSGSKASAYEREPEFELHKYRQADEASQ